VETGPEIDQKHTYKFYMNIVYMLTFTNMVTLQNKLFLTNLTQ